jgi:hypothetical protein
VTNVAELLKTVPGRAHWDTSRPAGPAVSPVRQTPPRPGIPPRTALSPTAPAHAGLQPRTGPEPRTGPFRLTDGLPSLGEPSQTGRLSPAHALPPSHPPAPRGLLPQVELLSSGGDEPPVTLPRGPARDAAKHELSKRMYHDHEPSLLLRALNHLWDWVEHLFSAASGVTPGGGVGLFVVVLAVLVLAALLWWRLGTPHRTPGTAAATLFDDRPRTAAEHRAAAEAHAAQGHWSQAVQERMRAVVRALEERTLLTPRPGRTADEVAVEVIPALPAHADRLRAAARDFDDVTYGGRNGDQDTYHRLAALDDDLARTRPLLPQPGTPLGSRP